MISEQISYINVDKTEDTNKLYSKVYNIHKYWSRKPWHPISECISKYTNEDELVLDMFVGSGVTALESIASNRNFIGFDLNPISIFICENTIQSDVNIDEFTNELNLIKNKIEKFAIDLYSSTEKCGICGDKLIIQHLNIGPKYKNDETGYFYCLKCGKSRTRTIRKLNQNELNNSIKPYDIDKWFPHKKFPTKFYKDRFSYKGITEIKDMYSNRNFYFLSELLHVLKTTNLKYKDLFLMSFSNTVLHASKLKSENVRPLGVNNYWVPDDYFEENPWLRFLDRVKLTITAKSVLKNKLYYSKIGDATFFNKSCFDTGLSDNSVDYIITDPPYGDGIQYSELSFIWNAWMNFEYNIEEEVIINPVQDKGLEDFLRLLENSVKEAHRILKKDKYYTLCFHNKEFKIWSGVLDIFKKHDFVLEKIDIVKMKGNSYNSNWAKFSPKSDLYLTFRKDKFNPTHNKKFTLNELLKTVLDEQNSPEPAIIYNVLSVKIIAELYFNEYQIDISKFTIKKLAKWMEEARNGN